MFASPKDRSKTESTRGPLLWFQMESDPWISPFISRSLLYSSLRSLLSERYLCLSSVFSFSAGADSGTVR